MKEDLKILALIPARAGSKRLPEKNKKQLGDKPLVAWSIESAKGISEICDILVSTDDPEIVDIAESAGALVPWLRPPELATDTALSVDVALHALDWYETKHGSVDGLLLLQPTSPFRKRKTIRAGIERFRQPNRSNVVGVSRTHSHPMWMFRIDGNHLYPYIDRDGFEIRSQDLPELFVPNGLLYLCEPNKLRKHHSLFGVEPYPIICDSFEEALDIDTEFDFKIACYFASQSM